MAHEANLIEIVHPGAAERAVGDGKTGRLDDVRLQAEAGAQAQNRPGVLGDVGLEQRDPHGPSCGEFEVPAVVAANSLQELQI